MISEELRNPENANGHPTLSWLSFAKKNFSSIPKRKISRPVDYHKQKSGSLMFFTRYS